MDSVKDSNMSSKKAMKVLLSVSAISFMFSYSSLLIPFLINSFTNVYVSAFTQQPSFTSSSTLDKSYVFLLFNGILVIIVKNSGLIGNKSPELDLKTTNHDVSSTLLVKTTPVKATFDSVEDDDDYDDEEKESEQIQNGQLSIIENSNNITEEEEEEPCPEEFNKKCEDFIRRVKEEIMFGAR